MKVFTKMYKTQVSHDTVNQAITEFRREIKAIMRKEKVTLRTLFNRLDNEDNEDGYLTYMEFKNACKVILKEKIDI